MMRHLWRHARRAWGAANPTTTTAPRYRSSACHRHDNVAVTTTTTTTKRSYHVSSPAAASSSSDPATIRLYRILLRQCRELQQASSDDRSTASPHQQQQREEILLQPPLHPDHAGHTRMHPSSLQQSSSHSSQQQRRQPPTAHHVLRLFGQWREQELSARSEDDDDDDEEATVMEEDKLIAWLTPYIADQAAGSPWMDTWTLWTTPATVREAVRLAFRRDHHHNHNNRNDDGAATTPEKASSMTPTVADHRAWAIRAYQYLHAQTEMHRLTRFRQDESGVRITALARCIGRSASTQRSSPGGDGNSGEPPVSFRYRFIYRIRIENNSSENRVFQLLGRSWIIQEIRPRATTTTADGKTSVVFGDDGSSGSIKVHAPQTGAVGKHPVIEPGQFFEYMSGCDLATPEGLMKGSFHFAWVPGGTPSAAVGQAVPALDEAHADQRFEVPVTPFPLQPDNLPAQFDP